MPADLQLVRAGRLGGLDQSWIPAPGNAARLEDATWDSQGGWKDCGGYRAILDPLLDDKEQPPVLIDAFVGVGKVNSMHWFSQHNTGIQFLLWEMGTDLVMFNGSTKGWDVLATSRYTTTSPWQRTQYCSVGNNTWIINGEDAPLRFDGERMHPAGHDVIPSAPDCTGVDQGFVWGTTFQDLGLGTARTGTDRGEAAYSYMLTEVNEFGTEGPPSGVSNKVIWVDDPDDSLGDTVPGPKYFLLVDIPKASGTHVITRRLYRCRNSYSGALSYSATHYFCREVDTPGRVRYIDALPDSDLGTKLDRLGFGPWPRGAKFIKNWQGTTWLAGMPEYPDRVAFSAPLQFENFPPLNILNIGTSDAGEITALYASKNALIVFKRRGIYIVFGDHSTGFQSRTLTEDVGCHACNSVRELPGFGVIFASDSGVYVLASEDGTADTVTLPVPIHGPIQDFWQHRVTKAALANAYGELCHDEKEYWLALPVDGQSENSTVLVYNWAQRVWSERPNIPMACAAESHDHRGYFFFGSNDDVNHPGVHVYSHGWPDKDGDDINFLYETTPMEFGGRYENFSVMTLQVFVVTYGNVNLDLNYYKDRQPTSKNTSVKVRDSQDLEFKLPVWDTAKWSTTETWQRHHPASVRIDPSITCREFAFRLEGDSRIQIVDWEIGIRPGPDRGNVRTINGAIATGSAGDK